jgi:archaellum component FlaC
MNITKSELKQLIHEALSEAEFNPFKQKGGVVVKSDDTVAANAAANAEFDRLDALKKGKKIATSGSKPVDDYQIDYEKRMKNLIVRRDLFQKKLNELDAQLNAIGKQMKNMKNATDQLNLFNTQIKPLMREKEKVLSDLKDVYESMSESWNEILKKHSARLSSMKTIKKN